MDALEILSRSDLLWLLTNAKWQTRFYVFTLHSVIPFLPKLSTIFKQVINTITERTMQAINTTLGRVNPWSSKLTSSGKTSLAFSWCLATLASFFNTRSLVLKMWLSCTKILSWIISRNNSQIPDLRQANSISQQLFLLETKARSGLNSMEKILWEWRFGRTLEYWEREQKNLQNSDL